MPKVGNALGGEGGGKGAGGPWILEGGCVAKWTEHMPKNQTKLGPSPGFVSNHSRPV